ncbi:MAG: DUF1045 domain-containing protein [Pseudomonadota bacterium]
MDPICVNFAVSWIPRPGSALARFGAGWTGWCADRGDAEVSQELRAIAKGRKGVPGSISRHGLHAHIKSPFALDDDSDVASVQEAIASVARTTAPITLPRMEVTVFDGRVVMALAQPDPAVTRLVCAVASVVDPHLETPAYADEPDMGVSHPALRDWGSCDMSVIERFHIPLTDRLELGVAYQVVADLRAILDPILTAEVSLADLALVGDPGDGQPWRLLERYQLTGSPGRDRTASARTRSGTGITGKQFGAHISGFNSLIA